MYIHNIYKFIYIYIIVYIYVYKYTYVYALSKETIFDIAFHKKDMPPSSAHSMGSCASVCEIT